MLRRSPALKLLTVIEVEMKVYQRHITMLESMIEEPRYWRVTPNTADDLIEAGYIETYVPKGGRFRMPGNYRMSESGRKFLQDYILNRH